MSSPVTSSKFKPFKLMLKVPLCVITAFSGDTLKKLSIVQVMFPIPPPVPMPAA